MLKIKDSVDLKELEKFGFKEYNYINHTNYKLKLEPNTDSSVVIGKDRKLKYNQNSVNNNVPTIIYDLIDDGLVEKVSDEND